MIRNNEMKILGGAVRKNKVEIDVRAHDNSGLARTDLKLKNPSQIVADRPMYIPNAIFLVS